MENKDFDDKRIAQGYKNRPFLHKQVMERFRKDVTDITFSNGLDIGCGAGLSSRALKQICRRVTGADISPNMVETARELYGNEPGYEFIVSNAEEIHAPHGKYDIATGAGVIQWVDREPFLQNLQKIMCRHGYVVIYDFSISDQMEHNTAYTDWWHNAYLKGFPKPYRDETVWTGENVAPFGFSMLRQVQYEMRYTFDMDTFLDFMMIKSNVNAKIRENGAKEEKIRKWFRETLSPVFNGEKQILLFTGYSWYLERV